MIDIDGVAAAHAEAICARIHDEYGIVCCADDVREWDHDFGPITFTGAVKKYYPDPEFVLGIPVLPGFESFLSKLSDRFEVKFASARDVSLDATVEWVARNFGTGFAVEFTKKKSSLRPDYLIDDHPDEVMSVAQEGGTGLLLQRPWNCNHEVHSGVPNLPSAIGVSSFEEAIQFLNRSAADKLM